MLSVATCPLTAAAKARAAPEWISSTPQDVRYLYGVGVSSEADAKEARVEAVAMGIGSVATAIFSVVNESYEQTTDENRTTVRDRVNLRTAHALEGVEVVEVAIVDPQTYALVRYPRAEVPAARMRYITERREAEYQAANLIESAGSAVNRFRSLIQAANMLAPYGGHRYDDARATLFMAISDLKLEASRAGNILLVTPADLPVRLGARRFTGKLNLTDADRLRNVLSVDTVPFCAMIEDRDLSRQVAEGLNRKQAEFQGDCVSVCGRLAGHLTTLLPDIGICVAEYSPMRLTAEYTAVRDEAYSLPVTTIHYTISLSEGSTVKNAKSGAVTVIGDEQTGIRVAVQQMRAVLTEWFR